MAAVETATSAARLPGPPGLLPGEPDAIVDLQTAEGVALVGGEWRYSDARVEEIGFVELGAPDDPLGPGTVPNRTFDVVPHAEAADYDDSAWRVLAPEETMLRLANGRVCFDWYRIAVAIPERVGDLDPTGMTVVFETVLDDYAEIWVDGQLPLALGDAGGQVVAGFNAPNRVVLTRDARAGDRFQLAVFGINGPISASPRNYIWMRTATLDFYAPERARIAEEAPLEVEGSVPVAGPLERIAGGFESTDGPLWTPDGALLFSAMSSIYRWREGVVTVFRSKSGSGGLAFDPEGRLTICQLGNGRVLRVNPHGDTTVLADELDGPRDLVYGADGTLLFTDGSGVYRGRDLVTGELDEPTGIALSPDEQLLYVATCAGVVRVSDASELLADVPAEGGIEVDEDGRLYVCGPEGISILSPAGERLGLLRLPERPTNLTWGDDGGRTLYVTAEASVYRLRLDTKGVQR